MREVKSTILIARASMLNRHDEKEINDFNDFFHEYIDLYYPEDSEKKEQVMQDMAETFRMMFRDQDGNPKELTFEVGDVDAPSM